MNAGLLAGAAAVVALLVMLWKAWRGGEASAQAKQAAADSKARDIADDIEGDVGALPPVAAKEELRRWSKD